MNSEVEERTLREVYLRPFEAAVKDVEAWALMSSYNRLNANYTFENTWLLTTVLRQDRGFDGIVMSDWFGSHSTTQTVNADLDLEMPGWRRSWAAGRPSSTRIIASHLLMRSPRVWVQKM